MFTEVMNYKQYSKVKRLKRNSVFIKMCRNLKMLSIPVIHPDEGLSVEILFILKVEKSQKTTRNSFSFKSIILNNKFYIYLHAYTAAQVTIIKLTRAHVHTNRDESNQTKALGQL
jgi:hypothetical protein